MVLDGTSYFYNLLSIHNHAFLVTIHKHSKQCAMGVYRNQKGSGGIGYCIHIGCHPSACASSVGC